MFEKVCECGTINEFSREDLVIRFDPCTLQARLHVKCLKESCGQFIDVMDVPGVIEIGNALLFEFDHKMLTTTHKFNCEHCDREADVHIYHMHINAESGEFLIYCYECKKPTDVTDQIPNQVQMYFIGRMQDLMDDIEYSSLRCDQCDDYFFPDVDPVALKDGVYYCPKGHRCVVCYPDEWDEDGVDEDASVWFCRQCDDEVDPVHALDQGMPSCPVCHSQLELMMRGDFNG